MWDQIQPKKQANEICIKNTDGCSFVHVLLKEIISRGEWLLQGHMLKLKKQHEDKAKEEIPLQLKKKLKGKEYENQDGIKKLAVIK